MSELGWLFAASVLGIPLFLVQFKGLSLTTVSRGDHSTWWVVFAEVPQKLIPA